MEEYFTLVWDWLGDEGHRARLLAIISVLSLIGGFLVWVFGLFNWVFGLFKRTSGGNQRASGGPVILAELETDIAPIGDFTPACAIRVRNTGPELKEKCLAQIENHGLKMQMPDPFVIRTEGQIRGNRTGRFTLSAEQPKLIPILFRVPANLCGRISSVWSLDLEPVRSSSRSTLEVFRFHRGVAARS